MRDGDNVACFERAEAVVQMEKSLKMYSYSVLRMAKKGQKWHVTGQVPNRVHTRYEYT